MIQLFECDQCKQLKKFLIMLSKVKECGYLCTECWKIYDERLKQIFFSPRKKIEKCTNR